MDNENEIIENEEIVNTVHELTPEEIAEQEKEERINALNAELSDLTSQLSSFASSIGDWKIIKCHEATLQGKSLPYDIDDLMEKRQQTRDRINEIQEELKELED